MGSENILPHSLVSLPRRLVHVFIRIRPQTGNKRWSFVESLWRTIGPLIRPWCNDWEEPTAVNVHLYRDPHSCVRWHSDDESLFGGKGVDKLIVSIHLSVEGSSVLYDQWVWLCCAFFMVTCWSWMGQRRTIIVTARLLAWRGNGLT